MLTFIWVSLGLVAVAALIYFVAAGVFGPGEEIRAAEPDTAPGPLVDDHALSSYDLENVRFRTAIRGYNMDDVDAFLDRIADEFVLRDNGRDLSGRHSQLHAADEDLPGPAADEPARDVPADEELAAGDVGRMDRAE